MEQKTLSSPEIRSLFKNNMIANIFILKSKYSYNAKFNSYPKDLSKLKFSNKHNKYIIANYVICNYEYYYDPFLSSIKYLDN